MRDRDLNMARAVDPQPGDYWHEMFCAVALVIEADTFRVRFLDRKKSVDAGHWTWDTEHIAEKTRAEFAQWLRYGSVPGTWADVVPEWKHWREFADESRRLEADRAMAAVRSMSGAAP